MTLGRSLGTRLATSVGSGRVGEASEGSRVGGGGGGGQAQPGAARATSARLPAARGRLAQRGPTAGLGGAAAVG